MEHDTIRRIFMNFFTINNKIVAEIEEKYMIYFHKAMKKFKIIVVGYNASQQKDLHIFEENGWELLTGYHDDCWMYCAVIARPIEKMNIEFRIKKRLSDDVLEYDYEPEYQEVNFNIFIDKTNDIFETIKQLEKLIPSNLTLPFGNGTIKYTICHTEKGYVLECSYPFNK